MEKKLKFLNIKLCFDFLCNMLPEIFLILGRIQRDINTMYIGLRGPDSSVGIATDYGLDGPRIESSGGEIFRTCPNRPWGPPSLL